MGWDGWGLSMVEWKQRPAGTGGTGIPPPQVLGWGHAVLPSEEEKDKLTHLVPETSGKCSDEGIEMVSPWWPSGSGLVCAPGGRGGHRTQSAS